MGARDYSDFEQPLLAEAFPKCTELTRKQNLSRLYAMHCKCRGDVASTSSEGQGPLSMRSLDFLTKSADVSGHLDGLSLDSQVSYLHTFVAALAFVRDRAASVGERAELEKLRLIYDKMRSTAKDAQADDSKPREQTDQQRT